MRTIAINENNDISLDNSNNLEIKTDLQAMGDIYVNKSQTNLGELAFNQSKGIDFLNTIFSSPSYPDLFQSELLTQLENTDNTQQVTDYEQELNKDILSYSVKINTDYGEVILNG